MKNEYRKIMKILPDYYKLKSEVKSITQYQILIVLKLFIEKDKEKEGWIKFSDMLKILAELQFKTAKLEVEAILRKENDDFSIDIEKEKITFDTLVRICDILKREKYILVTLGSYMNYLIFLMLLILIVGYISYFYSYKLNNN